MTLALTFYLENENIPLYLICFLQLLEDFVKNVSMLFQCYTISYTISEFSLHFLEIKNNFLLKSCHFFYALRIFICCSHKLSGDGRCVICDSYVRPCTLVRICDECNYGSYQGRCVICGGPGVSDAYYCKECTVQEKDVSS